MQSKAANRFRQAKLAHIADAILIAWKGRLSFFFSSCCWKSLEPDGHENIVTNHCNSGACILASNVVTSTGREELATSTLPVIRKFKFRQEKMKRHATRQLPFQCGVKGNGVADGASDCHNEYKEVESGVR